MTPTLAVRFHAIYPYSPGWVREKSRDISPAQADRADLGEEMTLSNRDVSGRGEKSSGVTEKLTQLRNAEKPKAASGPYRPKAAGAGWRDWLCPAGGPSLHRHVAQQLSNRAVLWSPQHHDSAKLRWILRLWVYSDIQPDQSGSCWPRTMKNWA